MRAFRTHVNERTLLDGTARERMALHDTEVTVYSDGGRRSVRASDQRQVDGTWETDVAWSIFGGASPSAALEYAEMMTYAALIIDGIAKQRAIKQAEVEKYDAEAG